MAVFCLLVPQLSPGASPEAMLWGAPFLKQKRGACFYALQYLQRDIV